MTSRYSSSSAPPLTPLPPVWVTPRYQGESVYVAVKSGFFDHFTTVIEPINLCKMNLTYNSNDCPAPGYYRLSTQFSVPSSLRDSDMHYTPDLKIQFLHNSRTIGCATTGSVALHRAADTHAQHGALALGVATLAFVCLFALLLFLSYRRKKRLQEWAEEEDRSEASSTNDSDTGMKYQYFRTLPNGQVVPIQTTMDTTTVSRPIGLVTSSRIDDDDDVSDPMSLSLPSYNETHLPTRPII